MLDTMCLTSFHNIQQDLINFIPVFFSLLMQMIFFLLLKQTVPNSDTRYFRASVIYIYTNPMVMYELIRIRQMHTSCLYLERFSFYLYMQPKIISECITLMTSKRQRHTYISHTGNMVEI